MHKCSYIFSVFRHAWQIHQRPLWLCKYHDIIDIFDPPFASSKFCLTFPFWLTLFVILGWHIMKQCWHEEPRSEAATVQKMTMTIMMMEQNPMTLNGVLPQSSNAHKLEDTQTDKSVEIMWKSFGFTVIHLSSWTCSELSYHWTILDTLGFL